MTITNTLNHPELRYVTFKKQGTWTLMHYEKCLQVL